LLPKHKANHVQCTAPNSGRITEWVTAMDPVMAHKAFRSNASYKYCCMSWEFAVEPLENRTRHVQCTAPNLSVSGRIIHNSNGPNHGPQRSAIRVNLLLCKGFLDSPRRVTTQTAGGNTHSWCCCSALSHQIPGVTVVGLEMLGLKVLPGWHVHLNCNSGLMDFPRRATTQTAGGNTHSWCCC
jgi:hypothetical protein